MSVSVSASTHAVVTVEDHAMKLLKKLPDKKKCVSDPHYPSFGIPQERYEVHCHLLGPGTRR